MATNFDESKTVVSEGVLQHLQKNLTGEWRNVGRHLKVADPDIEHIGNDYNGDQKEINYQMLLKWRQHEGQYATYEALEYALREVGRNDLADYVRKANKMDTVEKQPGSPRKTKNIDTTSKMDTVEEQPGSSRKTKQIGNSYGKFLVMLAGLFTLRIVLDLATYFTFPRARYDELQRAEYPGQLLVNDMQERGIISFYDISSLINALEELNIGGVKNEVLSLFKIHTSKNTVLLGKLKILQDGLKAIYKIFYNAIQPIPYIREKLYCVHDIFVDSGIQLVKVSGKKTPSHNTEGDTTKTEGIHMKSYRDIFDSNVLSSKRIIVEGEPGYGKSTLTIKAAYDWCNAKSPSPLAGFEVFILLKFRLLRGITSIYKAIKLFALSGDCTLTEDDIKEILAKCSQVVIVLDGFDEYPDMTSDINSDMMKIIKGTMFAEQNIVLCTRTGCLPRNIVPGTVHVRLTGFDDVARDQYIRLALGGVTNEFANELKQDLDENPIMSDLCEVPLFFVMFAHLASDSKDILNCDSVTKFFIYMINCFYNHMWKKDVDVTAHDMFPVETADKSALCKLAFEGLTDDKQTLVWEKKEFFDKVGKECFEELIKIGILVEEKLLNDVTDSSGLDHVPYRHVIRFYHKVFTEWYAAHHLGELAKNISFFRNWRLGNILKKLDPQDVQFVFRFACGLKPITFTSIFKYLGGFNKDVATLCLFEAAGKFDEIKSILKKMCSKVMRFSIHQSRLLQRSRIQLLNIASENQISISHVWLEDCYSTVYLSGGYHLQLKSNLTIPVLTTLNKLTIYTYNEGKEIRAEEFTDILQYSSKCLALKELCLRYCLLPQFVQAESVSILRSRSVKVIWWAPIANYQLNLHSCLWEPRDGRVMTDDDYQSEVSRLRELFGGRNRRL